MSERYLVAEDFSLTMFGIFYKDFFFSCFTYIVKFPLSFKNGKKIIHLNPASSECTSIVFSYLSPK